MIGLLDWTFFLDGPHGIHIKIISLYLYFSVENEKRAFFLPSNTIDIAHRWKRFLSIFIVNNSIMKIDMKNYVQREKKIILYWRIIKSFRWVTLFKKLI